MRIKHQQDFYAGLMFLISGLVFASGSTRYPIGTADQMGPGYFPLLLGVALAGVGIAVTARGLAGSHRPDGRIGRWAWHPLICITGASILFAICLSGIPPIGVPILGMGVGVFVLVGVASLAAQHVNWSTVLGLTIVLAVGSYLVFIKALGLLIPMWPSFLTD